MVQELSVAKSQIVDVDKPKPEVQQAVSQILAAKKILAARMLVPEQPQERGLAKPRISSINNLNSLKTEVVETMESKDKCGVCNRRLELGDVYYTVNLADFGCKVNTNKVCGECIEAIKKSLA